MSRVRCPKCDCRVKVPADDERRTIRCTACGHKIRVDDTQDEDENSAADERRGVSSEMGMSRKKLGRRQRGDGDANPWPAFVAAGVVVVVCAVGVVLSNTSVVWMGLTFLFSQVVGVIAFVIGYLRVKWDPRNKDSFSAIFPDGPLRVVMWLGFVACNVPMLLMVVLIGELIASIDRPRRHLPWLIMQVCCLLTVVGATYVGIKGEQRREPARKAAERAQLELELKKAVEARKPPPPPPMPTPQVTGDRTLDLALEDLGSHNAGRINPALNLFAKTKPKPEYRAEVAKRIGALADTPFPVNRLQVVQALKVWATPEEVPDLLRLCIEKDPTTKQEAIALCMQMRDARSMELLFQSLKTGRQAGAIEVLKKMGPVVEPEMLRIVNDKAAGNAARNGALRVLMAIGTAKSIPSLEALVNNKELAIDRTLKSIRERINK